MHTSYYTLHTTHYILHTAYCTLDNAHYTLYTAHCTLNAERWTLNTERWTLNTEYWTLHNAHYSLHTIHCKLNAEHWTLNTKYWTLHTLVRYYISVFCTAQCITKFYPTLQCNLLQTFTLYIPALHHNKLHWPETHMAHGTYLHCPLLLCASLCWTLKLNCTHQHPPTPPCTKLLSNRT